MAHLDNHLLWPTSHKTSLAPLCCVVGLPIAVKDVTAVKGLPFTEVTACAAVHSLPQHGSG